MLMIKARSIFLTFCLMFLVSGVATAKNNDLQDDMVDLERVYISVLALTSMKNVGACGAMHDYEANWASFRDDYKYYKTGYRKWISYFNAVDGLISHAGDLIPEPEPEPGDDGKYKCPQQTDFAKILEAHEVLEEIRTTMEDFRGQNGFPRFIADDFTAFHSIMGEIIGIAGKSFDEHTLDILDELYIEASQAWVKVENSPFDPYTWYFTDGKLDIYDDLIINQRTALDKFEYALSIDDIGMVKIAAKGLKPNQAQAYMMLSNIKTYFVPEEE